MAGKFAPVLTEPGQANIRAVQTVLPRPAQVDNSIAGIAGAVLNGIDVFRDIMKTSKDRRVDEALEQVEQSSIDSLIDQNLTSGITPEGEDVSQIADGEEALPGAVAAEIARLDQLDVAAKQGRISQDTLLIERMSGIRKIKAQFPTLTASIDAKVAKKWGYRPSNVLVERALRDEKFQEAQTAQFKDASIKASMFFQDPVTGEIGPPRLANGDIDTERAVDIGSKIIFAQKQAEALGKLHAAKLAAINLQRAQLGLSAEQRTAGAKLDAATAVSVKKAFDDSLDAIFAPIMESISQSLSRLGPDAKPAEIEAAMQAFQGSIRQTVEALRKRFDFPGMNAATRKEVNGYISDRKEELLAPFTDKDAGLLTVNARLFKETQNASKLRLADSPFLFQFTTLAGTLGSEWVGILQQLNPKILSRGLGELGEFLSSADMQDIARTQIKLARNPNAIDTIPVEEARANLQIARKTVQQWSKDQGKPMGPREANGFFNVQHNLAKAGASLNTPAEKREAALYFSNEAFFRRMDELEQLNPEGAKILGSDAMFTINESISATGRDLANTSGFGSQFTVEYDPAEGAFVTRVLQTRETPQALAIAAKGGGLGQLLAAEGIARSQETAINEAIAITADMNAGLRAVEQYAHLDASTAKMDRLQAREAVASSALLSFVLDSESNFDTPVKRFKAQSVAQRRFETVGQALTAGTRALQQANRSAGRALLESNLEEAVRRRYNPQTKKIEPIE